VVVVLSGVVGLILRDLLMEYGLVRLLGVTLAVVVWRSGVRPELIKNVGISASVNLLGVVGVIGVACDTGTEVLASRGLTGVTSIWTSGDAPISSDNVGDCSYGRRGSGLPMTIFSGDIAGVWNFSGISWRDGTLFSWVMGAIT
jgi:hypothetical protein